MKSPTSDQSRPWWMGIAASADRSTWAWGVLTLAMMAAPAAASGIYVTALTTSASICDEVPSPCLPSITAKDEVFPPIVLQDFAAHSGCSSPMLDGDRGQPGAVEAPTFNTWQHRGFTDAELMQAAWGHQPELLPADVPAPVPLPASGGLLMIAIAFLQVLKRSRE